MKMNKILLPVMAVTLLILAVSCKKDKEQVASNGLLAFHIHSNIASTEIEDYGETYQMADSTPISIDMAQLYISNIKLVKKDGSFVSVPGKIFLVKKGVEEYELGSVPTGNYNTVRFDIGLDTTTNKTDATAAGIPEVLMAQDSMWFGATWMGYAFVNLRGQIDTSAAKDTSKMTHFRYQIGSKAFRKTITMPAKAFNIQDGELQMVHMYIDYGKLFEGLDKKNNLFTDTYTPGSETLAAKIADNFSKIFKYED